MQLHHPEPFGARWRARWVWDRPPTIAFETMSKPVDADPTDVGAPPPTATASNDLVTVIVKLDEEPVATYRGTMRGLAATSPGTTGAVRVDPRSAAVTAYRAHLASKHATFTRAAKAAIQPRSRPTQRKQ